MKIIKEIIKYLRVYLYRLREDFSQHLYIEVMKLKKQVYISNKGCLITKSQFEGKNVIGDNTTLNEVSVGYGSYIGAKCDLKRTAIGKFCSIGSRVSTALGIHPTNTFASTHPAFYSITMSRLFGYVDTQQFEEWRWINKENRIAVNIGNDVWIANNALIVDGVSIGDGAIICAGAIVTKDIPPYAIVGGYQQR